MFSKEDPFSSYVQEAFRLECYPQYKVESERAGYELFVNSGELISNPDLDYYLGEAKAMIDKGKRHIRARVVPEENSSYFMYEYMVGYVPQCKIGVELFFLEKEEFSSFLIEKMGLTTVNDFWLFDTEYCMLMEYDEQGGVLKSGFVDDPKYLSHALAIRDHFLRHGKGINQVKVNYF